MTDNISEKIEVPAHWQNLSVLMSDHQGNLIEPLTPNCINLGLRINSEALKYLKNKDNSYEKRGKPLKIEEFDLISVMTLLQKGNLAIGHMSTGSTPSDEDWINLASYLDWSYQQQVGTNANSSTFKDAEKYGSGARDVWLLFTGIKKKLEKKT